MKIVSQNSGILQIEHSKWEEDKADLLSLFTKEKKPKYC